MNVRIDPDTGHLGMHGIPMSSYCLLSTSSAALRLGHLTKLVLVAVPSGLSSYIS